MVNASFLKMIQIIKSCAKMFLTAPTEIRDIKNEIALVQIIINILMIMMTIDFIKRIEFD